MIKLLSINNKNNIIRNNIKNFKFALTLNLSSKNPKKKNRKRNKYKIIQRF